jgi:uncharacterized membrane protein YfcA
MDMAPDQILLLCAALLAISFLYSSVGHAGASGYIAIMTLFGLLPGFIRPTALILNILVASIATWQFCRAGHFVWRIFWPYALLSVPCAFLGGMFHLPTHIFKIILGIILVCSSIMLLIKIRSSDEVSSPNIRISIGTGGILGLLAGITGTGGGIFLTPILILAKWAKTKQASATSALFILVNSISGLAGFISGSNKLPTFSTLLPLLGTVLVGGSIGSYFGSRRFSKELVRGCLSVVLLIAAFKLMFSRS